jgi:importin-4
MWKEEDERDVVNELCNSFSAALMVVGPALIYPACMSYTLRCTEKIKLIRLRPPDVEPLCTHLDLILRRQAPCQLDDEEEAEAAQALGEQSEYDAALISSACDLVGTIATVLGGDFAQLFPTFLPNMAQYYVRCRFKARKCGD